MYVVTGATGNLGRVVVEDLLTRVPAAEIRIVVRDPAKATGLAGVEVVRGDYEDPESLRAALAGADVALLVSSPDTTPGTRPRQHGNVIDAAVAQQVGRLVYTSAISADTGPGFLGDHKVTEQLIRDSGLTSTVLRNSFYSDIFVNPGVVTEALGTGEIVAADGGQALNTATIADFGLAASAVLTGAGHEDRVYELRGPLWTYDELAATITELSGKVVEHRAIPLAEAGDGAFIGELVSSGFFAEPGEDLATLLGRTPTDVRALVRAAL